MDSKIHTMIMSSILAFSLIAGLPTVFAQSDTGTTSEGGDMGNMTMGQGENMTQTQSGMPDVQSEDDGGGDKDDGDDEDDDDDEGKKNN